MKKILSKFIECAFFLSLLLTVTVCGENDNKTPPPPPPSNNVDEWELVFEENFYGNAVDETVWDMYNSWGHENNGLRRPEAFSVADGILTVTAQMKDGQLVSGGMAHRVNYTYGKFEFRVKMEDDPSTSGVMSGVVLTWPQAENWPIGGEIDIFETGPGGRTSFFTVFHYDYDNKEIIFRHLADTREWITMAMEWFSDVIRIYRNNVLVYTLTVREAIPQEGHHLCIQLDASQTVMTGRTRMYVDWVKIYQLKK